MKIIKKTLIGGMLFLVPLILLLIIGGKAIDISQKVIAPIIRLFPDGNIVGIGVKQLIAILLILIICFIAGLIASAKTAKKFVGKIDDEILSYIPGYTFMKKIGEGIVGIEERNDLKVVLVKVDDAWQLAFIVEEIDENLFTVFVPDAPSPWSGSVYHIEKDRMKFIDITQKEAMSCLRKLGYGSVKFLKGKL